MIPAVKWWKSIKFWQKLGLILTPLAAGGEIALAVNNASVFWHALIVGATILSVYATKVFTDNNGDGVIDQMQ